MAETLYEILKIPNGSDSATIKSAYKRLVREYHPDTRKKGLTEKESAVYDQTFLDIQEAYELLSDQATKAAYDSAIQVVEEHKEDKWEDDEPYNNPGVWNIPTPPGNYSAPRTSGSVGYYGGAASNWTINVGTSGSSFYINSKARWTIDVANVATSGLMGISVGDIVYVSSYISSPTMSISNQNGKMIPCVVVAAHYSTAPGLPAAGHFELEEL